MLRSFPYFRYFTLPLTTIVLFLGSMESSACRLAAAEPLGSWPQWRGPNRDGVSPEVGLLSEWPEGGPPLAWRAEGLGQGYSSVALADGKIYTMGARAGKVWLMALREDGGGKIWETPIAENQQAPNCTPTVDEASVYAVTFGGDLVCCDRETGAIRWKISFPGDFGGKMMSGWGYSESPLIDGDRLICTPGAQDAMLAALNKRTGRGPGSGSAAISCADGHLYFRYQDGTMALMEANPEQYRLKGGFRLASRLGESWPHPAIANGRMYLRDQDVLLCHELRKK